MFYKVNFLNLVKKIIIVPVLITIFISNFTFAQENSPDTIECYTSSNNVVDINGNAIPPGFNCIDKGVLPNVKPPTVTYFCYTRLSGKVVNALNMNQEVPITSCGGKVMQYETVTTPENATIKAKEFEKTQASPAPSSATSEKGPCDDPKVTNKDNCYVLLEPLGEKGSPVNKIVIIEKGGLEKYLNSVFAYLLMIIVIIAVFYMIYGGILYLTTDIINKKMEGKEVIQRVVIGLIFIFSVWTIMNTINPNLLKSSLNFGGVIGSTIGNAVSGNTTYSDNEVIPPAAAGVNICRPEDIVVVKGIEVCKDIKDKFEEMINAANAAGITLTRVSDRGDWRSNQQQIELRTANCGGSSNVYIRGAACRPLTALPGESNHQGGHAVDFAEANRTDTKAYVWLTQNAGKYGFYNKITSEPWHWSRTGK